jgi:hypothetical protein
MDVFLALMEVKILFEALSRQKKIETDSRNKDSETALRFALEPK